MRTSTLVSRFPKEMPMMSPGFTSAEALAMRPFSVTLPLSHASLATVRLLISLEILRYLSSRMIRSLLHK